jgi:hypothetical protein
MENIEKEPTVSYAKSPKPSRLCENCDTPQKQLKFKGCGNCRLVYYCSIPCQRQHWKVHRILCNSILNAADGDPSKARKLAKTKFEATQTSSLSEIRNAIEILYDQDHARVITAWKGMTDKARFALVNELAVMPSKRGEKRVFRKSIYILV